MYPYEGALDDEAALTSIRLAVLELMKNGVTTFIDAGNDHPGLTAEVVGAAGLRCVVARSSFDVAVSRPQQLDRSPHRRVDILARTELGARVAPTWPVL